MYYYRVPLVGDSTHQSPNRPLAGGDVDADPNAYTRHTVGEQYTVYISTEPLSVYEEMAEDGESAVEKLGDDVGEQYPAPGLDSSDDEEFVCEECGDAFDSQPALIGHKSVHSGE